MINEHLKKLFADSELDENTVIRKFRITATDGKNYNTLHYNLSATIAVGYKVNSERAVQFRKWATAIVKEYSVKGYAMDDERLKNDGSILGKKYFEEQLQRIREIRLSERKFYQKITDIYATSIDYDVTAAATKRFFATVQNKLHWAIHGQNASTASLLPRIVIFSKMLEKLVRRLPKRTPKANSRNIVSFKIGSMCLILIGYSKLK
jgi:hypothetical protein